MGYKNGIRRFGSRILVVFCFALVAFVLGTRDAGAYDRWSINRDATNCRTCHGDFRAASYVSLVDGQTWGNLHNIHRQTMLNGDCDACHGSSTFPVLLGSSTGGTGLDPISCMGCHGRSEDAGHDGGNPGLGAGLRQHHTVKLITSCQVCHPDAVPANYKPVGEYVKPPYYANPGTNHPAMPTDPCNRGGKENFAGVSFGLDNDGDGLIDGGDPDCHSSRVDFDGDGKTDLAVWRSSEGRWFVDLSGGATSAETWGDNTLGDIPVPGDYDGDGKTDLAVWRASDGKWYVKPSSGAAAIVTSWGAAGDVPVPGDYDGDGKTDLAVWRASDGKWYVKPSSGAAAIVAPWGDNAAGDIPVPGDYDGDGTTDLAVWRASDGKWYVKPSSGAAAIVTPWGAAGDVPVPGDYDGDGKTDVAVWRPSDGKWYAKPSSPVGAIVVQWGDHAAGDIPAPGDYDGDGRTDLAVWRPSNGVWYVKPASGAAPITVKWGSSALGDHPLAGN